MPFAVNNFDALASLVNIASIAALALIAFGINIFLRSYLSRSEVHDLDCKKNQRILHAQQLEKDYALLLFRYNKLNKKQLKLQFRIKQLKAVKASEHSFRKLVGQSNQQIVQLHERLVHSDSHLAALKKQAEASLPKTEFVTKLAQLEQSSVLVNQLKSQLVEQRAVNESLLKAHEQQLQQRVQEMRKSISAQAQTALNKQAESLKREQLLYNQALLKRVALLKQSITALQSGQQTGRLPVVSAENLAHESQSLLQLTADIKAKPALANAEKEKAGLSVLTAAKSNITRLAAVQRVDTNTATVSPVAEYNNSVHSSVATKTVASRVSPLSFFTKGLKRNGPQLPELQPLKDKVEEAS